jgi:2-C-methyl-D-erythritol 4-phosphate cytidylyltransferase
VNSAVIVAGGTGARFGNKTPKQFNKIHSKEILSFSVKTFLSHPEIEEVVIVSHPDWLDHVATKYPECHVVAGGKHRQNSSLNGVTATSSKCLNVLIHDAARPFVTAEIISDCLSALGMYDGSAPIILPADSLIKWDGQKAISIDRSNIKIVQTPQCFKKIIISDVLKSDITGTDEIGMLLSLYPESKLKFIHGSVENIKITTQNDLSYFSKK